MKKILSLAILVCLFVSAKAQYGPENVVPPKANIEVTGTAELEIIPDMIYMSITLRERYEGKEKITIDKQEKDMKDKLAAAGIDLKNLSLSDATSDYVKIQYKKKDALNAKTYQLLLSRAEEVGKVFQALTDLKIFEADITKVDHSKIIEYRKDLRIQATRAAKDKATYMLTAIDEAVGKPLYIVEENTDYYQPYYKNGIMANQVAVEQTSADSQPDIQFQKIKLKVQVRAKFEIK